MNVCAGCVYISDGRGVQQLSVKVRFSIGEALWFIFTTFHKETFLSYEDLMNRHAHLQSLLWVLKQRLEIIVQTDGMTVSVLCYDAHVSVLFVLRENSCHFRMIVCLKNEIAQNDQMTPIWGEGFSWLSLHKVSYFSHS